MTSGEEPLAIPPIKDVGFPYQSYEAFGEVGAAIDRAMLPFSWQQYMIGKRRYARWVNAGSPAIQHREYGQYLAWVLVAATAGVTLVRGRVTQVSLRGSQGRLDGRRRGAFRARSGLGHSADGPRAVRQCGALVLTGPGVHRRLPHDPERRVEDLPLRQPGAASWRASPAIASTDIAIVGGGESALSCVAFLRAFRPDGAADDLHAACCR